jgi:hypothetical protein
MKEKTMKALIVILSLAAITSIGSVKYIDNSLNHLAAVNRAPGVQADAQSIQGGEDNTDQVLQPSIIRLQSDRVDLQTSPTDGDPQERVAGYEALNWHFTGLAQ